MVSLRNLYQETLAFIRSISVEYNGHPVNGTPFLAKAFNADKVLIGPVARGSVGQPTHFTGMQRQIGNQVD